MFLCKILVLQRLYQLSDEATQYQILDRLSFQRFLGLNLADPVPDQNTVREFREALQKAQRSRPCSKFSALIWAAKPPASFHPVPAGHPVFPHFQF